MNSQKLRALKPADDPVAEMQKLMAPDPATPPEESAPTHLLKDSSELVSTPVLTQGSTGVSEEVSEEVSTPASEPGSTHWIERVREAAKEHGASDVRTTRVNGEIDSALHLRFKVACIQEGKTITDMLAGLMRAYLEETGQ